MNEKIENLLEENRKFSPLKILLTMQMLQVIGLQKQMKTV
jgi:hypothetical protein